MKTKEEENARKLEWYYRNKLVVLSRRRPRSRKRQQAVAFVVGLYKAFTGCAHCGFDRDACALDLHHSDPAQKDGMLSRMGLRPWHKIRAEVMKCEVLCANCHRILEHRRRAG